MEKLTEGIVNRNLQKEGAALLRKWNQTGLLEGLNESGKQNMAVLLENQAKSLLKESNTMEGSQIEGFAAVAFPIVRRVFAGLIANDLVSVQPMSLPSGLIFFLDFKFNSTRGGAVSADSIYGQGVVGSQVTGGVSLNSLNSDKQPYGFASSYAHGTASVAATAKATSAVTKNALGVALADNPDGAASVGTLLAAGVGAEFSYDADLISEHSASFLLQVSIADSQFAQLNKDRLSSIVVTQLSGAVKGVQTVASSTTTGMVQVKRLTKKDPNTAGNIVFSFLSGSDASDTWSLYSFSWPQQDALQNQGGLGAIAGTNYWPLESESDLAEIDIKVDSIAITAQTKKLKAKWTPELGQDLNAYHNIDAEVELTSILSEQIALEIDREILEDLIKGATAGKFYWSRSPGMFLDRVTGAEVGASVKAPDFTGTVSEWYETLIETINDVSAQIHRKTLRGGATHVVCGPEVANILEFTAGFRANVTADADKGDIGAVKVGSLNKKFEVIVDPYFPRNLILVSRIGKSFLESGYVYAPYVPLQTTPTIFGTEDFVPRKGVMTRYGKKMVRPDMYGLVIVRGLLGESGQ